MTVTPQTKLADVLAEYPWLLDEAAKRDARLKLLRTLPGRALLRRATGYEEENGKAVPPDVRAAVFWLKNRRPARWKDGAAAGTERRSAPAVDLSAEEEQL